MREETIIVVCGVSDIRIMYPHSCLCLGQSQWHPPKIYVWTTIHTACMSILHNLTQKASKMNILIGIDYYRRNNNNHNIVSPDMQQKCSSKPSHLRMTCICAIFIVNVHCQCIVLVYAVYKIDILANIPTTLLYSMLFHLYLQPHQLILLWRVEVLIVQ